MNTKITLGVLTTLLPMTIFTAHASDTAVTNLNNLLKNTKSMTANFSQTTKTADRSQSFSGSMALERGHKFRWETKSPSEQLIVVNGNTMWIYDKDLQQATKQSVTSEVADTPALLLSGDPNQIARNFSISQPNKGKNYYVLKPKSNATNFRDLSISFNGGKPVMMVLNDSIGQTTSINFNNVNINKNIPAKEFSFTPPRGVDVINQ